MIVTQPDLVTSTTLSIRLLVPLAKFSNSNTPTGPFHTICLALPTASAKCLLLSGPQSRPWREQRVTPGHRAQPVLCVVEGIHLQYLHKKNPIINLALEVIQYIKFLASTRTIRKIPIKTLQEDYKTQSVSCLLGIKRRGKKQIRLGLHWIFPIGSTYFCIL